MQCFKWHFTPYVMSCLFWLREQASCLSPSDGAILLVYELLTVLFGITPVISNPIFRNNVPLRRLSLHVHSPYLERRFWNTLRVLHVLSKALLMTLFPNTVFPEISPLSFAQDVFNSMNYLSTSARTWELETKSIVHVFEWRKTLQHFTLLLKWLFQ